MEEEASSRARGKNKRFWTFEEDQTLIKYLHELSCDPKWKNESGFKSGYMNRLEEMIKTVLPNCGLRAVPHIESRIKHWSGKYGAMAEMLSTSGFGWDADKKMLLTQKIVFDKWAKTHKKAKGLYGVPFPHYETLAKIYANDKATCKVNEPFVGANHQIRVESDEEDVNSDSHSCHSIHSTNSVRSTTQSQKRATSKEINNHALKKPKLKDLKGKGKEQDHDPLVASLRDTSENFGSIKTDLGVMAKAWYKAEEREQKKDERVNKVLEEVMKLDGISPSETLELATIIMAEEHKLLIFYKAPSNLKKHYALDLLRKK